MVILFPFIVILIPFKVKADENIVTALYLLRSCIGTIPQRIQLLSSLISRINFQMSRLKCAIKLLIRDIRAEFLCF